VIEYCMWVGPVTIDDKVFSAANELQLNFYLYLLTCNPVHIN